MRDHIDGFPENEDVAKAQAKRLSAAMGGKREMSHAQALEAVARMHGCRSWGEMRAAFLPTERDQEDRKSEPKAAFFTLDDIFWEFWNVPDGIRTHLIFCAYRAISERCVSRIVNSELIPAITEATEKYVREVPVFVPHDGDRVPLHEWMESRGVSIRGAMGKMMSRLSHDRAPLISTPFPGLKKDPAGPSGFTLDRKHTLACCRDVRSVFRALETSGQEVSDLYREQDFSPLPRSSAFDLTQGFKAVNPAAILKVFIGSEPSFLKKKDTVAVVVSARDMMMLTGMDVVLTIARSRGIHIILVRDAEVPKEILSVIGHVWTDVQ